MKALSKVELRFAHRHLDSCRAWRLLVAAVGTIRAGKVLSGKSSKPFADNALAWLPVRPRGRG